MNPSPKVQSQSEGQGFDSIFPPSQEHGEQDEQEEEQEHPSP